MKVLFSRVLGDTCLCNTLQHAEEAVTTSGTNITTSWRIHHSYIHLHRLLLPVTNKTNFHLVTIKVWSRGFRRKELRFSHPPPRKSCRSEGHWQSSLNHAHAQHTRAHSRTHPNLPVSRHPYSYSIFRNVFAHHHHERGYTPPRTSSKDLSRATAFRRLTLPLRQVSNWSAYFASWCSTAHSSCALGSLSHCVMSKSLISDRH